ncbi:hypothetical protein ACH5RR_038727 [Cinchona calisaya]|uniref:Uncharacterized protein n=1 Tax=Cinchona calisaya TaxID=153742 RepID=A0ABD2XW47_9GENT
MMTPLSNVRQAYSLVIQEQTQRQLSSEPERTENFTIAANVQSKASGIKNTKMCDHCHRSGHTIEECRTLKYYCKFCDKSRHTEDRCRRKNNKAGPQQQNRASRSKPQSAANMAENSNMNDDNSLMSFLPEYLQQLAKALSTMNQNSSSGNSDVFANATAAESKISEPHIALDSSSPAHNSAPSPSPQDPPLSPQNNRPLPINSTLSSPQMFPLSESSSSSPPQPNDNFQHLRHSTRDRQPPAWHQEYFMSAAVNHSSPRTSPRRHTRLKWQVKASVDEGQAFWFWTVGHSVEARERIRDSRDMNEQLIDVQGPSRGVQAGHTSVNFGTNVSRSIHFEVTNRSPVCPGKFPNFHCVVPVMVLADKYHNLTVILNFHDQGTLSCVKKAGHGSTNEREVKVGRLQRQKVLVSRNRFPDSALKFMILR